MIEKILILILGGVVGFLSKLYWDRINQKRKQESEDRNILVQVIKELSSFMAIVESGKREKTSFEHFDDLYKLSLMIQRKENKDLADGIQKFVQENRGKDPISYKPLRTEINSLKEIVIKRLKKEANEKNN
jgi:hypothetical protein